MTPKTPSLWATLPGRQLLRTIAQRDLTDEDRRKFQPVLKKLRDSLPKKAK